MFLQIIENELEEAFPNATIMFKILQRGKVVFETKTFEKPFEK